MTRLFIYEAVTAGCFGASPPESLQLEGLAMLRAVLEDFSGIPGLHITTQTRPGVKLDLPSERDRPSPPDYVGRGDGGEGGQHPTSSSVYPGSIVGTANQAPPLTPVPSPSADADIAHSLCSLAEGEGRSRLHATNVESSEESALFRRLVQESEAVLVIAPELSGLLTERCAFVAAAQRRSLGCTPDAVRLAADKLMLAEIWQKTGVPTPATNPLAEFRWDRFPVVVKPRYGAGSQATRRISQGDDVESVLRELASEAAGEPLIVQPWHSGLAASVSFLCGPTGDIALLPGEQCLSADNRCQYLGTRIPLPEPYRSRAVALGRRALSVLTGRNGYVGIDLVLGDADDGSRDVAIEINPRLTTSYLELRKLSRNNLAAAWWRHVHGESISPLSWRA